ncbi:hypothetical protein GCM10027290_04480 [Micromonospora sonneratiae]|uniref:DUF4158 domain-containing protein n=1 Tax=Micromonospora sonneratiae TaxID=1184706 RepID=A0ABW3YJA1_9ACTN
MAGGMGAGVWQPVAVRREWELDELVASWTLVDVDRELLTGKHGATRLSFALMLKFFEIEGRFPRYAGEVSLTAVDYVARQLGLAEGDVRRVECLPAATRTR